MEFQIDLGSFSGIFALPCEAVDLYLNEASHSELKVLLYILRHCGIPVNEERMAESLGLTKAELSRAVSFWCEKKIFACVQQTDGKTAGTAIQPKPRRTVEKKVIETVIQYSAEEIAKKADQNAEIKFLLETVPERLGRLISPSECSAIVYLYDGAGLPADVILMAIEYCVSIGKANIRYIEKTALTWAEEGIDTHEMAESKILQLEAHRSFEGKVKAVMGITSRNLSQTEKQHLNRWHAEWAMSPELVKMAYDICVDRTGKLSFSYINSILKSWHEKGYTTIEQAGSERKQSAKPTAKPHSFSVDEYVRLSMKRLHDE